LVWSGNPAHLNDHNRSMPLQALKPLLELDYEFHSLHKEIRPEEQALLTELTQIHPHQDELHDYACTAALISAMDLIISVDTSVVHLAGALGKKIWVLLPLLPDWRWMLEREDRPWYPSARLFRQRSKRDWSGLIDNVIAELQTGSLR
jgi:ADP-heptose:LPS heptosyltransferase